MKGLFYSIMIALFLIPILALLVFYSQITVSHGVAASIRADELKYFSESIEEDLARFLQINGKRALVAVINLTTHNGTTLDSAPMRLIEVVENGTLYGNKTFDDQKNLSTWVQNISSIASKSGFDINMTIVYFNVTQNDSFSLLFSAVIYLNISDATAQVGISKNMSADSAVSIENTIDPLYQNKTNGKIFKTIKKSPYMPFNKITVSSPDMVNLTYDIKNNYYHNSTDGPSFLDRLEGKLINHYPPYGLESFVYLPALEGVGISVNNQFSDLDYQYWANVHGHFVNESFQSDPIYNWFRIDTDNQYIENAMLNTTT